MRHRGAEGADKKSGDGAGILLQIPHEFILLQGIAVPEKGHYGTGLIFMPKDEERRNRLTALVEEEAQKAGMQITHWREVPVDSSELGETALESEPRIVQIFAVPVNVLATDDLERQLYLMRKKIERRTNDEDFYIVSLSAKHIIYKGMLSSMQLRTYFKDLQSPYLTSGLALVHSRFSTNTFPRWSLAQPFRLLAHNGEINTIRGNRAWMTARENVLSSKFLGKTKDISPIIEPNMSDSASLDNVLEFLVMSGLSLPQAMAILIPESFNDKNPISQKLKHFYEYYSILMEPWDGPAAIIFSDGRYAGGMLDRNGLRPARYTITTDGLMIVASEVGVMDIDPSKVAQKGRLQPGKIILVDTEEGNIYYDGQLKDQLASEHPYGTWLSTNRIQLEKLKSGRKVDNTVSHYGRQLECFGFGQEDINRTIIPMCVNGAEPSAAMDLATKTIAHTVNICSAPISTEKILEKVCKHYSISNKDVLSVSRKKGIVEARQVSMYLTQKYTNLSSSQIGLKIGHRDHSTVLHACSQTENRISVDKSFRAHVESIESEILKNK